MFLLGLGLALSSLAATSPLRRADANPVVDLGYARFKGVTDTNYNVTSWYSLYYAAAPEGRLRWAEPVDIEKKNNYTSTAVYDATTVGPKCYQQPAGWFSSPVGPDVSENCLLLNVRKPVVPASAKLPVIVMIHGGGYDIGSAPGTGGTYFPSVARAQIVYVEIQYRLGGFGFLNSKEVCSTGAANAGLLDQRSALGWVQRHISAFGGDPTKVTIMGGSAGGGSVTAQLQLFGGQTKPPFRAAIADFPWWQTFHTKAVYNKQYTDLLSATKCKDLTCLRALSFATITSALNQTTYNAYQQGTFGYGDFYWGPGVDGKVIKELPHAAFDAGRFSQVPLTVNHDALEGLPFTDMTAFTSEQQVVASIKQLWPNANRTFFSRLEEVYPTSAFSGAYFQTPIIAATAPNTSVGAYLDQMLPGLANDYNTKNPYPYKRAQILGDGFVACATRILAAAYTSRGLPIWKMIFNAGDLVHAAEEYVLEYPVGTSAGHSSVAEALKLVAYYVSFATDLDPNKNTAFADVKRPQWAQYGAGANVMYDNFTQFAQGVDTDKSPRCQLMIDYADQIRN